MHKSMKSSTSPQPGKWRGKPGTMASVTFASLSYWEYACCRCLGKLVGEHHGIRTSLLTTAIFKTERRPLERLTGQHGSFVLGQYFFNSPTVETANCLTRMLDQNKLIHSNWDCIQLNKISYAVIVQYNAACSLSVIFTINSLRDHAGTKIPGACGDIGIQLLSWAWEVGIYVDLCIRLQCQNVGSWLVTFGANALSHLILNPNLNPNPVRKGSY